jgi:hypothetical protein
MPQYGSSQNLISTNLSQTVDNQGNPIISSDTGFAASPLGYAARAQALFGLPNSTFELTPPDTNAVISAANPLPYWDVQDYSSGVMSGSAIYDSTTNSWGVNLNPGTADTNDYITMTTRSYLINDSNLSLRQQALAVVSKVGTYAGTTQWNLELTASYYDLTNTLLHSGTVATIYDNATWTSMAGTTTTSGTAINASAHYVDLQFKLLATAPVTSATSVTLKSCLLQTSSGAGGKSFVVTETFTSSGTFNVPTGVEYVTVVAIGGGGGGGGGQMVWATSSLVGGAGSGGGGGSRIVIARDIPLGTATSVSVGIGAGGNGGAGGTVAKTTGGTAHRTAAGTNGSDGAATTFGSYLSVPGGGGGGAAGTTAAIGIGGAVAGVATATVLEVNQYLGGTGSNGGTAGTATGTAAAVGAGGVSGTAATRGFDPVSYFTILGNIGSAGGSATSTTTNAIAVRGTPATPGTTANYFLEGGGGGSGANSRNSPGTPIIGTASAGGAGGGGAGGGICCAITSSLGTVTLTAGNGGDAGANTGAGGGAGGLVKVDAGTIGGYMDGSRGTAIGGTGGAGGSGLLTVVYIG